MIDRRRSADAPPEISVARPARTVIFTGPSRAPRSDATRSHTTIPSDVPSTGGSDTSPPGSADTSPGFRQIPVSQAIGSRPATVARRSVPAGELTATLPLRWNSEPLVTGQVGGGPWVVSKHTKNMAAAIDE